MHFKIEKKCKIGPYNNWTKMISPPQSLIVLIQFLPIKQCCDITKLDCTHSISSHSTLLWHHKVWLYLFNFFLSNNVVTSQSFIMLILFLPIQQCCDTTKFNFTHSISSHQTMLWHHKAWLGNSMKCVPSVMFYFMKNSFSDITRKCNLPNVIGVVSSSICTRYR